MAFASILRTIHFPGTFWPILSSIGSDMLSNGSSTADRRRHRSSKTPAGDENRESKMRTDVVHEKIDPSQSFDRLSRAEKRSGEVSRWKHISIRIFTIWSIDTIVSKKSAQIITSIIDCLLLNNSIVESVLCRHLGR